MSKKNYLLIILLVCALVVVGAWAVGVNMENEKLTKNIQMQYRSDYEEFIDDISHMKYALEKCTLSLDEGYVAKSLSDAVKYAASAKETLSHLPVSQVYASEIQTILSKGEQAALSALESYIDNRSFTETEKRNIRAVAVASRTFLENIDGFNEEIYKEGFRAVKNEEYYFSEDKDALSGKFSEISAELQDMPQINYDGKYSSHIDESQYKGISGEKTDKNSIMENIKNNIDPSWNVEYSSSVEGNLPMHHFTATDGNNKIHLRYSVTGGNLISAISENYPDQSKITIEEAFTKADEFVKSLGHENMKRVYHEKYSNILCVTYAYFHNGIKCLSDTLTVQVSMKDGKILGYEAETYYKNHYDRSDKTPSVSVESAEKLIGEDMNVEEATLCYLPTEGGNENLCYEFLLEKNGERYLIYIDAEDFIQREMLRVASDENTFRVNR